MDKNLCEKLDKIKKQILYREELAKIKEREKRYLDKQKEKTNDTTIIN